MINLNTSIMPLGQGMAPGNPGMNIPAWMTFGQTSLGGGLSRNNKRQNPFENLEYPAHGNMAAYLDARRKAAQEMLPKPSSQGAFGPGLDGQASSKPVFNLHGLQGAMK